MKSIDDDDQPVGRFRIDLANRPRGVVTQSLEDAHRCRCSKRRMTGQHRVQDTAETEQIRTFINGVSIGLLRCHVLRCFGHNSALRQAGIIDGSSQSEVGDANSGDSVFQENVGRLNIAMHNSLRMSGR